MKSRFLFFSMLAVLLLVGCSQEKEVIKNDSLDNAKYVSQKPPYLKIEIHEKLFSAALNGYDWSYYDEEENSMASVEAETIPVFELIGNRKGPAVNSAASIELIFEEEPISYKVFIWDSEDNQTESFEGISPVGQKGRTVYEVAATWTQGTGHYFFPLTIE